MRRFLERVDEGMIRLMAGTFLVLIAAGDRCRA